MSSPAVTGSGESLLVTARSAEPLTVVVAVALLLAVFGSVGAPDTVAVFVSVDEALLVTKTTMVTVADAAALIAPSEHVTVVVPEHVPCDAVADTRAVPAGSVSDTVAEVAWFGPLFVTVIVYVRGLPTVTGSGESVFVIARSACLAMPRGLIWMKSPLASVPVLPEKLMRNIFAEAPGQEDAPLLVPHSFSRARWPP